MTTRIRILIVEDEQIVALDLKRRLTKLGYEVTGIAADRDTAMLLINKKRPNIILMDIHIQGKTDGVEVATEIQKTVYIPVIYLTAYSEEKTLVRAIETKPYGYLLKPFSERDLHIMIQVSMERYESDSLLKKKEQHFNLALEAARLGTWEIKEETSEVFIGKNPRGFFEQISNWDNFFASIVDNDKQKVTNAISRLQSKEDSSIEIEFKLNFEAATDCWFKLYGKSFSNGHPNKNRIVGILQDTSESHYISEQLMQAAAVFKYMTEGIVILGKDKTVESANDAFYEITGYSLSDLEHKELPFLTKIILGSASYNKIWRSVNEVSCWRGEVKAYKENGAVIDVWLNIGIVPGSKTDMLRYIVALSDITTVRKAQDQLVRLAYYDNLTDLPNRRMILDRLQHALATAKRGSHYLSVIFLDLDNFKRVNDTMGHQVGDEMLRAISQRLSAVLRESDSLGRLGGDEFVIILENIKSIDVVADVSIKILRRLSAPLMINGIEIIPTCSIGISVYPDDSSDHNELLQMADIAMYEAKKKGRNNYIYFHPDMMQNPTQFLTRESELYQALQHNEFVLYYQPQYSFLENRVNSVEALIRWLHPSKGMLSPLEIIPVAESSSLIVDIGNWVVREACRQLDEWRANGLSDMRVAVNISIRQLASNQLPSLITSLLRQYMLPPHLLELEITESCLQNDATNIACLKDLEKLGVSISIDDFGTGYSCMSSLKYLPIRRLKIDQSFVRDIPDDQNDCAISSAILALGRQLNMRVIAEGVETVEQIKFLSALGCDEVQGYYLSRSVAPQEIPELTKKIPIHIRSII